ncbi:MAG: radical SAM protein [Ignavibacteria bacterium]|jgi:uncharacterized protein
MENKKPNVIVFQTKKKNQYIYDACTNRVFPAPDPYPGILEDYNFLDKQEIISKYRANFNGKVSIEEAYNQIDKWVKVDNAFFNYETEIKEFSYTEDGYWEKVFEQYVPQLILSITDECNFRCRYCVYGGNYENRRTHSKNHMSFETAQKAVDYYLGFLTAKENTTFVHKSKAISFYGGEPLLNFTLIKKLVEYIKAGYDCRNIEFRITTNGFLLTDDVIDFIVDNNFSLAISMDGPKEEHDRNRVLKGGTKTFDIVYQNMCNIREKYKDYFFEKVQIQACYDTKTDLFNMNDFFIKHDKELPRYRSLNGVSLSDRKKRKNFDKKDLLEYSRNYNKLKESYFDFLTTHENRRKDLTDQIFRKRTSGVVCRSHYKLNSYTGNCTPGTRIFVTVDGTYHICERINEFFPVGDCDNGMDFKKVYKIQEDYYNQVIKENKCNLCTARHSCPVCFVAFAKKGKFEPGKRCENIRAGFKQDLIDSYSAYELNPLIVNKFYPEASYLELN